jgi:hypothetical protein
MVQLLCVVYFDAAPDGFAIFAVGATESRLRGGEVVAMDNFGTDLTFFPPFD